MSSTFMRFYWLVSSSLLIYSIMTEIAGTLKLCNCVLSNNTAEEPTSNFINSSSIKESIDEMYGCRGCRGAGQVNFFEAAGSNVEDRESSKDDDTAAIKCNGNYCSNVFSDEPGASDNRSDTRPERHVRYDSGEVRFQNRLEGDKSYKNLMKLNKVSKIGMDSSVQHNSIQQNEAFPINDDVSDFATYMLKNRKRKPKHRFPTGSQYSNYNEETNEEEAAVHGVQRFFNDYRNNNNLVKYSPFKKNVRRDNDLVLSDNGIINGNNNARLVPNLMSSVSDFETDMEDGEQSLGSQSFKSNVVSDIVREKVINLPEPLIYNSSHVVNSFVYTMIPFRSPLLNLLENDKHSKYIMIKIDPVLQQSKRIMDASAPSNTDFNFEKNIIMCFDKLIGCEHMDHTLGIESRSKSKKTVKENQEQMNDRPFRGTNSIKEGISSPSNPFTGVIS